MHESGVSLCVQALPWVETIWNFTPILGIKECKLWVTLGVSDSVSIKLVKSKSKQLEWNTGQR